MPSSRRAGPRQQGASIPVAVLCSGQGTNLQALLNASKRHRLGPARIALVLSDRAGAPALARAWRAGVPGEFVDPKDFPSRADYDRELVRRCRTRGIRAVCLAGFMRILSPAFVRAFPRRILNIHPALLPSFPGAHALQDALAWGAKVTGVTVHLVDEQVDHGPIVLQEAVAIRAGESEATLLARVHRVEHQLYVDAVRLLAADRIRVQGRHVVISR